MLVQPPTKVFLSQNAACLLVINSGPDSCPCDASTLPPIPDWNRPINPQHHPESWERPDSSFEAYVGEAVRHRLGKYVLPDHPNRISSETANSLLRSVHGRLSCGSSFVGHIFLALSSGRRLEFGHFV